MLAIDIIWYQYVYMGESIQIAARIDSKVKEAVEKFCKETGQKMNHFIENALLDRLEELEDIEDVKKLRRQETVPLEDIIASLKKDKRL